jgi:hypothetical protein
MKDIVGRLRERHTSVKVGNGYRYINDPLAAEAADVIERFQEYLTRIIDLSEGYDEDGSLGPKAPYSWESSARLAMDYARAARDKVGCNPLDKYVNRRGQSPQEAHE